MNEQELLDIIYQYYPRGLKNEDSDKIVESQQYNNRARLCHEVGKKQQETWTQFKNELKLSYLTPRDYAYSDFTAFGIVPCYHLQILFDRKPSGIGYQSFFYVLISILVPYWSFRFTDVMSNGKYRYLPTSDRESTLVDNLSVFVNAHFPEHSLLPHDVASTIVPDIDTPFSLGKDVTIFNAIFADD